MKISKQQLKELVKQVVREEDSDYKVFFQKALEKSGKSIPEMSDEEKKEFFNKIDAAWQGKGEKNESVNEAKVIVYNEKTGERYEVLSGNGKGDLMIAMKALQKAAPSHMKYSIKESVNESIKEGPVSKGQLGKTWTKNNKKGYVLKVGNLEFKSQGPKGVHRIFKDGKMWGTFHLDYQSGGDDWWVQPRSGKDFYADEIDDIVKRINSSNESIKEDISVKDGKYHLYSKKGYVTLLYNGKKIADGDFDDEDGSNSYWMNHSSFKGQKAFDSGKDVIAYFKKNRIVSESVNEAAQPGEWVAFLGTNKGKKLLKVFNTARGANQFMNKNMDKLLDLPNVERVGTMSKSEWDKREAKYAIEGVNEANYSNQTGIKSSLVKDNEFSSLLSPKEQKWVRGSDIKIYKDRFGFIFTDGKQEIVFNINRPMSIVKPLSRVRGEIKKIYTQNESINEDDIKVGSKVVVNYPTLKKPIVSIVKHILKSPTGGLLYVLKDSDGVWDEENVSLKENKQPLKEGVTGYKLLLNVSAGHTDRIEGIKVSKQMADTILDWMQNSPYGKKYGKQLQKVPFGSILKPLVGPFGIKKRMSSDLSGEFKRLAAHVENNTIA